MKYHVQLTLLKRWEEDLIPKMEGFPVMVPALPKGEERNGGEGRKRKGTQRSRSQG